MDVVHGGGPCFVLSRDGSKTDGGIESGDRCKVREAGEQGTESGRF